MLGIMWGGTTFLKVVTNITDTHPERTDMIILSLILRKEGER